MILRVSLVAQTVKNLPAMQETWVQSLGQKDHLEKEMATDSSILAWKIPWTEEPGGLQSVGSQRVGQDYQLTLIRTTIFIFEGDNGIVVIFFKEILFFRDTLQNMKARDPWLFETKTILRPKL